MSCEPARTLEFSLWRNSAADCGKGGVMHRRDWDLLLGLGFCLVFFVLSLYGTVVSAMAWGADTTGSTIPRLQTLVMATAAMLFAGGNFWLSGVWFSRRLELYLQIFERSNEAIAVIGSTGNYLMQNRAHRDLLGYDEAQLAALTPSYRAGQTDLRTVDTLSGLGQFSGEFQVLRQNGALADVGLSCFTIANELGDPLYFVEFKRDIDEFKKMEALIRQDRKRLEVLSHTDFLTGLYNRHKFTELADRELARSLRYDRPLSLIIFDIDYFKRVNDTYGHGVGDEVLKRVARAARERLRESDLIARWGGEEFLVLLPESDESAGVLAAEQLRLNIQESGASPTVSCSFGVARHQQGESLAQWVARADAALYAAKNNGRNRTEVASDHCHP